LRALAIALVIFWHYPIYGLPFPWKPATWAGVDLFFVLSGYLIGTQLLRPYTRRARLSYRDFFVRRALRVIPAYLVVLAAYFLIPGFRERPTIAPLWRFLTFTLNFGLDAGQAFSQGWSLCVEEHFYLLLPLLVPVLMRKPGTARTATLAVAIVLGGMLLRGALWIHCISPHYLSSSTPGRYLEVIYYPTYNRLDGLLTGVLVAALRLFRPLCWDRLANHGNALLAAGVLVLAGAFWICQSMFSFATAVVGYPLLAAGFGLLVMGALMPGSLLGRARLWGAPTVALLSYSLYLTHKEVMHLDNTCLPGVVAAGAPARLLLYGATFALAAGSLYLLVERPALWLRDRWLAADAPSRPPAAQS